MFDRDKWYEIWVVLSRNPIRTLLTAFGVFWGIFMLIIMLGSGKGLENGVKDDFGSYATNSLFVWTSRTSIPYKGLPQGRFFNLKNDDVPLLKEKIPQIKIVAPRCQLGGYGNNITVSRNNISGSFPVMGDVPELQKINPKKITEGRFLNQMDILEKRKVVVIGQRVRDVLFDRDEEAIGEYFSINGVYFRVIGVFKNINESRSDDSDLETIYTPITSFQQSFNFGENIGWLSINTKDGVEVSTIEDQVIQVLAERHLVSPEDKRAFGHYNMEEQFLKMQNLFIGIRFLIWLVGIGTLLAGVIGISNIMLIVVKERTREIGIRKAIGAPPSSIVTQIVAETIILTSIAGYVGLVIGVFTMESLNNAMETYGLSGEMFRNPEVDFTVAITATIVIILAGAIAGLIPASKAARINAVIALKSEG